MLSVRLADATVVVPGAAHPLEHLAARELQRYLYLLTGSLRPISAVPVQGPMVLVGEEAADRAVDDLAEQEILLQTVEYGGYPALVVAGGSPSATQWAAYALLEQLGCGFYLGGDALPARRPDLTVSDLAVRRAPVLAIRGTLPWYNFLNSPTTWNLGDHRRFYDQLAKQGANFVGYHSYDWEPWAGYPGSWAGVRMGEPVATSGSSRYVDQWGAVPTATVDYAFGTDQLFEHSLFGAECAFGYVTHLEGIRQQQVLLAEALRYARSRGIRTCLGFEVAGDPDAAENIRGLRERLQHLVATYDLDYVWLWQAEGRGGGAGHRPSDTPATEDPLATHFAYLREPWRIAEGVRMSRYCALGYRLLQELAPGVRLIVSGWGGDHWMAFSDFYAGLDTTLPDDVVFAALDNIDPTFEPHVSAVYGRLRPERERWPIPWFESDGGGTRRDQWGPQPNVYAFAPLLNDTQQKGCQGILGIHWRTRAIEEVAGYTFRRAWDPDLSPESFFAHFAHACYGPEVGDELAALHRHLEELGPRWTGAMGQVECGPFTWFSQDGHELPPSGEVPAYRAGRLPLEDRFGELAGIESRLAALHDEIESRIHASDGSPNATAYERITYLLRTVRWLVSYDRAALQLWRDGPVEAALARGEAALAAGDAAAAASIGQEALELMARSGFGRALQTLAENVTNQGELGVLATVNGKAVAAYKRLIARSEALTQVGTAAHALEAGTWPAGLRIWAWSPGDIGDMACGLPMEIRALGPHPVRAVTLHYRALGAEDAAWDTQPCQHRHHAVYRGIIPIASRHVHGLEYYVSAQDVTGATAYAPLGFPVTVFTATILDKHRAVRA